MTMTETEYEEAVLDKEADEASERKKKATMLRFEGKDIAIQLSSIKTIETIDESETLTSGRSEVRYGIIINRGLEYNSSMRADMTIWYDDWKRRDAAYNKVMNIMSDNGYEVINV